MKQNYDREKNKIKVKIKKTILIVQTQITEPNKN